KHERTITSRITIQTDRLAIELNSSADPSKSTPHGDEGRIWGKTGSSRFQHGLPLSAASRPASLTKNSRRTPRSHRFALDHSRVVEIVLDRLAGKGGRGHQRHALRR